MPGRVSPRRGAQRLPLRSASSMLRKHQLGWMQPLLPARHFCLLPGGFAAPGPGLSCGGDPLGLPARDAEDGAACKHRSLCTSISA